MVYGYRVPKTICKLDELAAHEQLVPSPVTVQADD